MGSGGQVGLEGLSDPVTASPDPPIPPPTIGAKLPPILPTSPMASFTGIHQIRGLAVLLWGGW